MGEDGEELPYHPYTYLPNSAKNERVLQQTTSFHIQPSLAPVATDTGASAHTHMLYGAGKV